MLTRLRDTAELQRIIVPLLTVCSNTVQRVMRTRLPLEPVHATTLVHRKAMSRTAVKAFTDARCLELLPSLTMTGMNIHSSPQSVVLT
jgi:hypothetical protein